MILRRISKLPDQRLICLQKLFSSIQTVQSTIEKNVPEISPKKTKSVRYSASKEICEQMKGSKVEYFLNNVPKKILRKGSSSRSTLYLINQETAKILASMISNPLKKNASIVVECNPGLGLLTEELLNNGISSITLYEKSGVFLEDGSPLARLFKIYKDRLNLKRLNFFDIWMILLRDQFYNENNAEDYLINLACKDWEDETFAQIIALCPNRSFLSLFIHNFFKQTQIFENGRPAFYLVMSSLIWNRLLVDHNNIKNIRYYSQYNVMLNLFFDFECLGEVPRKSFVPWPSSKKKVDEIGSPMFVIKIEPKPDVFLLINKDDLKGFWFFLKHSMRTRKNRVIVEFEKLVPGSGPKLIEMDIDICTTFKDLSPNKLLEIFKNFRSWPEYDENLFSPSLVGTDDTKKDHEKLDPEDIENIDERVQNKELTDEQTETTMENER